MTSFQMIGEKVGTWAGVGTVVGARMARFKAGWRLMLVLLSMFRVTLGCMEVFQFCLWLHIDIGLPKECQTS